MYEKVLEMMAEAITKQSKDIDYLKTELEKAALLISIHHNQLEEDRKLIDKLTTVVENQQKAIVGLIKENHPNYPRQESELEAYLRELKKNVDVSSSQDYK